MQIADYRLWLEAVEATEIVNGAPESMAGFERFQIADVLAEEDIVAHRNRDCVLEMSAHGEDRRKFPADANAERSVAARTAEDSSASSGEAHYRVIARPDDWAIVH